MSVSLHPTGIHEAGHAVVAWHHWRQLPESIRLAHAPFVSVTVRADGSGEVVLGDVKDHLSPWAHLCIALAGHLAESAGLRRYQALLSSIAAGEWLDEHDRRVAAKHPDATNAEVFMEQSGCPREVLNLAARHTVEALLENRDTVARITVLFLEPGDVTLSDVRDVLYGIRQFP